MKKNFITIFLLAFLLFPVLLFAEESGTLCFENSATGFSARIRDDAHLLSQEEENALLEKMSLFTEWGNALFYTTDDNPGMASKELAATTYKSSFGSESGSIFLIDMKNRMLYIYSDGDVYKAITVGYANTITDNVYKKASGGNYYECAYDAFSMMITILSGGRISQPMKHASNALIALIIAMLICYIYMRTSSKTKDEMQQKTCEPIFTGSLENISVTKGSLQKRIIETSSADGGGSRGGGYSGGGHSGGGGGHRF